MKRRAILIESSRVRGLQYLSGAELDVKNWNNFLQSSLGGAWDDIRILRKPSAQEVREALAVPRDTFCFVAFSGHGEDGSVCLNDNELSFPISRLKPLTDRGVVIVDACRGVETSKMINFSKSVLASNESQSSREMSLARILESINRPNAAALFERYTLMASVGIVLMQSCSSGQYADEDPTAGGVYTLALLEAAGSWAKGAQPNTILSTKYAHKAAAAMLPVQQTPEYAPASLEFPFAVKV